MKLAKIIPIAILFIVTVTLVSATHTSSITMTPNSWAKSTSKDVSISVTNNGADNIVKVELMIPKDSNQVPLYIVGDITTPQGWTFTYTTTGSLISKISWITSGSGIASGTSLSLFGLTATSPSSSGDYTWNWKTSEKNNGEFTGTLTTTVGKAPLGSFVISGTPATSNVGTSFKITVKAYGDDNQLKTDYTGKISFTSTDTSAVLPSEYTFQASDYGSKEFLITYKSAGSQSLTIRDVSAGISKESSKTLVKAGAAVEIALTPENKKVSVGEKVEFKVTAKDALGNSFDITDKATITIDKKAGGSWNKSVYTTENEGSWIVIANYNSLFSGTTLFVSKITTIVTPTEKINITPTIPAEATPEITLTVPESITIAPGANDTTIITVNNNGDKEVTGVEVSVSGIPSDWISIYPLLNDIPAKSSKDYLVIIFIPNNESGSKTIDFKAKAGSVEAAKSTELKLSSAPTGSFTLPKNVLQLGVVIIAVAAVVIIGWELWFKKPKSK